MNPRAPEPRVSDEHLERHLGMTYMANVEFTFAPRELLQALCLDLRDAREQLATARAERDRLAKSTRSLLDSLEGLYREGMIDESPEDAAISAREFVERDATCIEARRALATGGQPPEETK